MVATVVVVVVVVVVVAAVVVTLAVVVKSLRMILCIYIVGFSCFLKRRSGPTDLWMEGRMDGPMDLQMDGPTEIPSYRDVRTHPRMGWNHFLSFLVARPMMLNQHFAF